MKGLTWVLTALVLAPMPAVGGPAEKAPPARTETTSALAALGVADDGKAVEVAQGGKILVHLPGDVSGKGRWSRVPSPLGPLTVLENRVDRTSRDGKVVKETYVFSYRTTAPGTVALQFAGTGAGPVKNIQFTVTIVPSVLGERLADMRAATAHMAVGVSFVDVNDKAFTDVYLASPNAQFKGDKPVIRLSAGEARRLVEALADSGCLNQAVRYDLPLTKPIISNTPTCTLTILGPDGYLLHLELGWDLAALTRLDSLAGALDAKGQAQLKKALAPLEAHRAQWQAATTQPATQPH
ncbi:MAG: hypothetical protein NTV86_20135 [Planctomycetota bacterium]|nr:hypothetical protein [Planctomycetota bacterium]